MSQPAAPTQSLDLDAFAASLPQPPIPVGSYVPVVQVGNLVFTSGTLPLKDGELVAIGPVGSFSLSMEQGQVAARQCALNALSLLNAHLGSLRRVRRVVKLTGYVHSAPAFYQQPAVINGASDLLVEVFGDPGRHARSAVGVYSLPLNAAVEIDLVVEVDEAG